MDTIYILISEVGYKEEDSRPKYFITLDKLDDYLNEIVENCNKQYNDSILDEDNEFVFVLLYTCIVRCNVM